VTAERALRFRRQRTFSVAFSQALQLIRTLEPEVNVAYLSMINARGTRETITSAIDVVEGIVEFLKDAESAANLGSGVVNRASAAGDVVLENLRTRLSEYDSGLGSVRARLTGFAAAVRESFEDVAAQILTGTLPVIALSLIDAQAITAQLLNEILEDSGIRDIARRRNRAAPGQAFALLVRLSQFGLGGVFRLAGAVERITPR